MNCSGGEDPLKQRQSDEQARNEMTQENKIYGAYNHAESKQRASVNRFMVHYFCRMILNKYSHVFFEPGRNTSLAIAGYEKKVRIFLETVLKRARSSKFHFKKVCCTVMAFAERCNGETNYMRFLRYDFLKLLVASFVFTDDRKEGHDFTLYSSVSGMTVAEIKNCCSIIRPNLTKQRDVNKSFTGQNHIPINTRQANDCALEQSAGTSSPGYHNDNNNRDSREELPIQVPSSELKQFNEMGIQMVRDYLNLA